MIDRTGQVWEDEDGALIYLVVRTKLFKGLIFVHHVLYLYADSEGFNAGELSNDFEKVERPWEETARRRLL